MTMFRPGIDILGTATLSWISVCFDQAFIYVSKRGLLGMIDTIMTFSISIYYKTILQDNILF